VRTNDIRDSSEPPFASRCFWENELLAKLDDFGAWAFRSVTFGEFDTLAGLQFFEADALKRGRMEEKVFTGLGRDESEAPVGQALDSSFSHLISPEKWSRARLICRARREYRHCLKPCRTSAAAP
jgi:hypothetical protein